MIIDFIVKRFIEIKLDFLGDLLDKICNSFDSEISLALIGFEVTLVAIIFALLPFVIREREDKYLGFKRSEWILYERRKNGIFKSKNKYKYPDIACNWIINIFFIMLSIIFYLVNCYVLVGITFFVFLILFSKKVVSYLYLATSDKWYNEVEDRFLYLLATQDDLGIIGKLLSTDFTKVLSENILSYRYMLSKIENKNMGFAAETFYKLALKENKEEYIYYIFKEISGRIKENENNTLYYYFQPWDFEYLLRTKVDDGNIRDFTNIIHYLITNSINITFNDVSKYNQLLSISYNGILANIKLNDRNKKSLLKSVLNNINRVYYINNFENTDYIKYKYGIDFFINIINKKDEYGKKEILVYFGEVSLYTSTLKIYQILTLIVYLYYLIEIEKMEDSFYIILKDELVKKIHESCLFNNNAFDIKVFSEYILKVSVSWDIIYDEIRTFKVEPLVSLAIETFDIIYGFYNHVSRTEEDLNIFKNDIVNNNLNENVKNRILDFIDFLHIKLEKNYINTFIKSLCNFANDLKLVEKNIVSIQNFDEQMDNTKDNLFKQLLESRTFNVVNCEGNELVNLSGIIEKKFISELLESNFEPLDIMYEIEKHISSEIINNNCKKYVIKVNKVKEILTIIDSINENKVYITNKNDNLGKAYNLGNEYNSIIEKFDVVMFERINKRFFLDNFECCLKQVDVKIVELTETEKLDKIKDYLVGKTYKVMDIYGFSISYNKTEIINYVSNNFCKYEIIIEFGLNISNDNKTCISFDLD